MNIRDEELLQRYFERHMSNAEEQNFLIDVAARDDMRMAFRSQLELIKAVRRDKDVLPSAASVRERTLGALGFAGVVLPATLAEEEVIAAPVAASRWRAFMQKPLALLSGGLLAGSLATFAVMNTTSEETKQAIAPVINAPAPTEMRIEMPAEPTTTSIENTPSQSVRIESAQPKASHVREAVAEPTETGIATTSALPIITTSKPAQVAIKKPKIVKPE